MFEPETWVLNDSPIPYNPVVPEDTYTIKFVSNDTIFGTLKIVYGAYELWYDSTKVFDTGTWAANSYKTITFTEKSPSGDLLTWLQANATKQ